jgi:4-oxalomesaconate tautomerase
VISRSSLANADVDYLFLQVAVDKAEVSDSQNCGNLLAGVGPWAIENGLVPASGEATPVRIHMVNTRSLAVAQVKTPGGAVEYEGDAHIDGVPGTAAPVSLEFLDVAGSSCGSLLPTGNVTDVVDGIEVTCIDNGMPVIVVRASDLGVTGVETPAQLEANAALKARVEALRLALGPRMNLGDVTRKTVPKVCLVSAPRHGGAIATATFIPHRVHEAIGVLGAVSVATAVVMPESVANRVAVRPDREGSRIQVEHPSGFFTVDVDIEWSKPPRVRRAALLRTARKLLRGEVFVPASVWRRA